MICYEPLSQHGEALDMAGLVLIAKFFKPGRAGNKPVFSFQSVSVTPFPTP
jgi:hypothetical protein